MIEYKTNFPLSVEQYIELLTQTSLAERRPITEKTRVAAMLSHCNLLVSAWQDEKLVGAARALTDFAYCCYLSDLAVAESAQKQGIGKQLIAEIQKSLTPQCKIILLAAPQAVDYYPHIGFTQHPSAWIK